MYARATVHRNIIIANGILYHLYITLCCGKINAGQIFEIALLNEILKKLNDKKNVDVKQFHLDNYHLLIVLNIC